MSDHSLSLSLTQYGYVMQTKLKFGHDLSKFNIDLSKSLLEYVKVVTCICQVATSISCISCPNCGNALIDCMESILFNCCFFGK